MVNWSWLENFPQCIVEFQSHGISDHSAVWISIGVRRDYGPKPFKFFNAWGDHKYFQSWVAKAWSVTICKKLKAVMTKLKLVNKEKYGNLTS